MVFYFLGTLKRVLVDFGTGEALYVHAGLHQLAIPLSVSGCLLLRPFVEIVAITFHG